jgi:hypothetical protein
MIMPSLVEKGETERQCIKNGTNKRHETLCTVLQRPAENGIQSTMQQYQDLNKL